MLTCRQSTTPAKHVVSMFSALRPLDRKSFIAATLVDDGCEPELHIVAYATNLSIFDQSKGGSSQITGS